MVEWRLEKLMKENEKNHDSYCELIRLCGELQNVETALHIFSLMEAQGLKPNSSVFNALLSACLSSHNFVTALSLFELMESSKDYKSDSDTYNAFISAHANLGNKKAMQAWYSAKIAAGFSADLQTYESLILGCLNSKDFPNAEIFYEEMTVAGFIPNVSIMQNMLIVYCENRNLSKIKEYMKYAMADSWRINRHTVAKIVNLFDELGSVRDMEELLVTLTNLNQTLENLSLVHSAIIRMYARINRLDDVEYSVGRMLKQGISFRCPEDIEKVISLYFRQAAYDRLDLFLKCIKDSYKFRRSTYDLLVAGYRRAGLQDKLDVLKNDMKLDGFFMS